MEPREREQMHWEYDGLDGTAARQADVGDWGPTERLHAMPREIDQLQARLADQQARPERQGVERTAPVDRTPETAADRAPERPGERSAIQEIVDLVRERLARSRDRGMEV
jgi:hypothetical protein